MPPKKKPQVEKGQMSLLTSFGRSSAATTPTPSTEPDTDSASTIASRLTSVTEDKAQRHKTQNILLSVKLGQVDYEKAYRIWKSEKPRKLLAKK